MSVVSKKKVVIALLATALYCLSLRSRAPQRYVSYLHQTLSKLARIDFWHCRHQPPASTTTTSNHWTTTTTTTTEAAAGEPVTDYRIEFRGKSRKPFLWNLPKLFTKSLTWKCIHEYDDSLVQQQLNELETADTGAHLCNSRAHDFDTESGWINCFSANEAQYEASD